MEITLVTFRSTCVYWVRVWPLKDHLQPCAIFDMACLDILKPLGSNANRVFKLFSINQTEKCSTVVLISTGLSINTPHAINVKTMSHNIINTLNKSFHSHIHPNLSIQGSWRTSSITTFFPPHTWHPSGLLLI